MKIEDQICSLEQAKRLKELGVSQESYFVMNIKAEVFESWMMEGNEDEFFAAYTLAEMGMMLPNDYVTIPNRYSKTLIKCFHTAKLNHRAMEGEEAIQSHPEKEGWSHPYDTEAEARGAVLIYLLEKKFITAEEANERLK